MDNYLGLVAVGAYVSAPLTKKAGLPMTLGIVFAIALTAAAGTVVALVTARLRGHYLAIITLGFSEVIRLVASNEIWLANPARAPGRPRPRHHQPRARGTLVR